MITAPALAARPPMPWAKADSYSRSLINWLGQFFERLTMAGSSRRGRPLCNDVGLVGIPRATEDSDVLGAVTGRTNHALKFLQDYVRNSEGKARFLQGGEVERKEVI